MLRVHGTCVAIGDAAVLLRGRSGSGKSDLALRLIDRGGLLVADDLTGLEARDGALWAVSPRTWCGHLEVRGIGPLPVPSIAAARVALVGDCRSSAAIARLPEPAFVQYCEVTVPLISVAPFEASADAKLRLALLSASRRPPGGWLLAAPA